MCELHENLYQIRGLCNCVFQAKMRSLHDKRCYYIKATQPFIVFNCKYKKHFANVSLQ